MSKGKQGKTQGYKLYRSVLQRLLAYNIGYALLEKAIAVTLGSTFPSLSTRNAKKGRGMVIGELRSWAMEQLISSLWANSNEKYSPDDINLATRKFPETSVEAVISLIEGKQTRIEPIEVMAGAAAIYDAKTVIAYLGPLYKDKFYGMLTIISSWATYKLYKNFEALPCEELTNGVLVGLPSLMRDKGLTWATRPTEFPAEVFDELMVRAEKWGAWTKREEEYEKKIEQAKEENRQRIYREVGSGVDGNKIGQIVENEFADAMSYMLPGTKVSIPKDFPKGYEPPPLPSNGSVTWPQVLGAMGGIGSLGNNFGSITTTRVVSSAEAALMKQGELENWGPSKMREIQQALSLGMLTKQQVLEAEYMESAFGKPNTIGGIPYVTSPALGRAKVTLAPEPEPEPISPFDSKPRQFSFEEE